MEIAFETKVSAEEMRQQFTVSAATSLGIMLAGVWIWLLSPLVALFASPALAYALRRTILTYLQVRRHHQTPDTLVLDGDALVYTIATKPTLRLALRAIQRVDFQDGLSMRLRQGDSKRWTVLDPTFRLAQFLQTSRAHKADLFFPFFNASVQARLQQIVELEQPYDSQRI